MSFACFPRLPGELQDKIWGEACCVTRVLDIRTNLAVSEQIAVAFWDMVNDAPIQFWTTHQRAPSLLHTCQEARSIGLQHYVVAFGTEFNDETDTGAVVKITTPPSIYVNWNYDIVCPFLIKEDYLAPAIPKIWAANALTLRYLRTEKRIRRFAINSKRVNRSLVDVLEPLIVRNGMEVIVYWPDEQYHSCVPPFEIQLHEIVGDLVEVPEGIQPDELLAAIDIVENWVASNWHKKSRTLPALPRPSIRPMIMQPIGNPGSCF